jgi:hypothetical protein
MTGDLTLHGVSRPLTFVATLRDGRFLGTVSIRQRDSGIQPISIVGGTGRVKDEVESSSTSSSLQSVRHERALDQSPVNAPINERACRHPWRMTNCVYLRSA